MDNNTITIPSDASCKSCYFLHPYDPTESVDQYCCNYDSPMCSECITALDMMCNKYEPINDD